MEKQLIETQGTPAVQRDKRILIALLYAFAIAIVLLGAAFSVYSAVNDVRLTVLTSSIPGVVFGLVVAFLGVRYVFSIQKLKTEVYRTTSAFSWSNFRKSKND
ncbi:MAG: hypothetical protein VB034_00040 [Eubacteriales bacterium]|nr:hypothetical protein [Eubacteriales bacterium]